MYAYNRVAIVQRVAPPQQEQVMKLVILLAAIGLTACSSFETPNVGLETDKTAYHMTRSQVILGINECESAGTRPVVISAKRKINGVTSDVPVEVTCHPRYRIFQ